MSASRHVDCFNPRARTGRDSSAARRCLSIGSVSIHAPVRGATRLAQSQVLHLWCFNPRARTGRDALAALPTTCCIVFQSTRPYGARRSRCMALRAVDRVSIHAPVRGATPQSRLQALTFEQFQSTRPYGARHTRCACNRALLSMFQSTRPYGARRLHSQLHALDCSFNPRARTGRDSMHRMASDELRCFNPRARTGRDRLRSLNGSRYRSCFNPRARTGRDVMQPRIHQLHRWFQSTRPYGARPCDAVDRVQPCVFQSTRPYGARRAAESSTAGVHRCFNPRARTGRDGSGRDAGSACRRFNPRARTGRDAVDAQQRRDERFNPRARTGRDGWSS